MDYIKIMVVSTKAAFVKMWHEVFYVGGILLGTLCYLTGLTPEQLSSVLILIIVDILSRVWAEKANKRSILSRKMYSGFVGKIMAYSLLFIACNQIPVLGDYLKIVILTGFGLIELRSVYENLLDAKQKHLDLIGDKIGQEIEKFRGKPNEEFKKSEKTSDEEQSI